MKQTNKKAYQINEKFWTVSQIEFNLSLWKQNLSLDPVPEFHAVILNSSG